MVVVVAQKSHTYFSNTTTTLYSRQLTHEINNIKPYLLSIAAKLLKLVFTLLKHIFLIGCATPQQYDSVCVFFSRFKWKSQHIHSFTLCSVWIHEIHDIPANITISLNVNYCIVFEGYRNPFPLFAKEFRMVFDWVQYLRRTSHIPYRLDNDVQSRFSGWLRWTTTKLLLCTYDAFVFMFFVGYN